MPKSVTASANVQFDEILERTCVNLQITPSMFNDAKQKYEAIASWLGRDGSPIAEFSPHIFPQGSLRLDTTVRPFDKLEFDLDLVCLMQMHRGWSPAQVYELIWDRMACNGIYKNLISRKRRCIRVDYAGEFHLDIVPAIPDWRQGGNYILVPDIPKPFLINWKPSNPLDYVIWFKGQEIHTKKFAEASVMPLSAPAPAHLKSTLKRSVQLFKRWRDVYFKGAEDMAPPSIILTTIAGHLHEGEEWCTDALATILTKLDRLLRLEKLELYNPANRSELISERWRDNPDSYREFVKAIRIFQERWLDLIHSRGMPTIAKELKDLFGEPAIKALRQDADRVGELRQKSNLYVTNDALTLTEAKNNASLAVSPNHFYGD